MLIMMVYVHVKPEYVEAFKQASIQNATNSIREPGVIRFDVVQETGDATRFALIEIYKGPEDIASHRETAHYKAWKEVAEPMMAEARTRTEYVPVFPPADQWK